jgi:hypothetical protein
MKTSIKNLLGAITLIAFLCIGGTSQAQINVESGGAVGIGTNGNTSYKLQVYNNTSGWSTFFNNSYSTSSYIFGIRNYVSSLGTGPKYGLSQATYASSSPTSTNYGIYNYSSMNGSSTGYGTYNYHSAGNGTGVRYGLYNYLSCGSNTGTKYGLYSGVSCGGDYAGYFSGNVFISGTLTAASDAAKKQNIEPLQGALAIVSQLDAKTYDYIQDANMALPTEHQFGFLAQDLEKVLPQLVKEVENPAAPIQSHEEGDGTELPSESGPQEYETVKSVNYIGLIPVLVKAMQEQQTLIEEQSEMLIKQQAQIEELKSEISKH